MATVLVSDLPSRGDDSQRVLEIGGAATEAAIGRAGDVDGYRFRVSASGDYRIETQGSTQLDVTLFGPDDAQQERPLDKATYRDSTPDLVNRRLTVRLKAGEYLIQVRHARAGGIGKYRIGVSLLDRMPGARPR